MGKIIVKADLHTHTIASGHAFSTIIENIEYGKKRGIETIAITEHTDGMLGGANRYYFWNLRNLPDVINGVKIIRGAEANIINNKGELDIESYWEDYQDLELIIASMHSGLIKSPSKEYATETYMNVIKNPRVKIIGHPDHIKYDFDMVKVFEEAKKYGKIIEINNASALVRGTSIERMKMMIGLLKDIGNEISLGSDSHFATNIGNFEVVLPLLEEVDFPADRIYNNKV